MWGAPALEAAKKIQNDELTTQILEFCRHVAWKSKIVAVAEVDNYSLKDPNERTILEVMLVIHDFQPRLMSYLKSIKNKTVFVFAVDQWIFERDIDRGMLGEAIASKLVFPYHPLLGESYLREREGVLKQRLVLELLENIIINFPELAHRIQILPQYFMYEVFVDIKYRWPALNGGYHMFVPDLVEKRLAHYLLLFQYTC